MKIEMTQEMMKVDFKSEIDLLKLSIKEEIDKLLFENKNFNNKDFLKFMNEFIKQLNKSSNFIDFKSKSYLIFKYLLKLDLIFDLNKAETHLFNIINNNDCLQARNNTQFSIAKEIKQNSPSLNTDTIEKKKTINYSQTKAQNTVENKLDNPFFPDISDFSDNINPCFISNTMKNNHKTIKNIKSENIFMKSNPTNNQYNPQIHNEKIQESSVSNSKLNKINIRLCQSKEKEKYFNDLNCYSNDLLDNTFKNLKINQKKMDKIIKNIKSSSISNNPFSKTNLRTNKFQNKFDTISESNINNYNSKDESLSRSVKPLTTERDCKFYSVDGRVNNYRKSLGNSTLNQYEAFYNNTYLNSIINLKLKDIDHQEAPNQVILRFDEEIGSVNTRRNSRVNKEKDYDRKVDNYNLKSYENKFIKNIKNNLDDSLMEILNENKKVEVKNDNYNSNDNNIDNQIDPNLSEAKNIDVFHENALNKKKNSKNFIEKFKKSQSKITHDKDKYTHEDNAENLSLISYGNFAVLSESSNSLFEAGNNTNIIEFNKKQEENKNIDSIKNYSNFENYDQLILMENLDEKINNLYDVTSSTHKKSVDENKYNKDLMLRELKVKNLSPIKHLHTIDCNNTCNLTPKKTNCKHNIQTIDNSYLNRNFNFTILNTSARKSNMNSISLSNYANKMLNSSKIKDDIISKNYKNNNLRAYSLALLNNKYDIRDDDNNKIDYKEFSAKDRKLKDIIANEILETQSQETNENNKTNTEISYKLETIGNNDNDNNNKLPNYQKGLVIDNNINNINIDKVKMIESDSKNLHNSIKSFNFTFMKNSINLNSNKNLNKIKDFKIENSVDIQLLTKSKEPNTEDEIRYKTNFTIDKPINISMNKTDKKEEKNISNSSFNYETKHSIKVKEIKENNRNKKEKSNLLIDTSDITYIHNSIQTSKKKGIFNSIFTMKTLKKSENSNKNIIIYAGGENVIKFWDYESNLIIKTLKGHKNHIYCLKQINSNLLLSGSLDKTIKLWDIESEKCLKTFNFHTKAVSNIMKINFSFDSNNINEQDLDNLIICSASWDGLVKFFNITSNVQNSEIKVFYNKNTHDKFGPKANMSYKNNASQNLILNEYQETFNMANDPLYKENNYTYINKENNINNNLELVNDINTHNPITCMKKIKLINEKEIKYLFAVAGKMINIYSVYQRVVLNDRIKDNYRELEEKPNKYRKLEESVNNLNSQRFVKKIKYELNCELPGHDGYVNDMKFMILDYYYDSYQNTMEKIHLLTVGNDKIIKLWNIKRKEVVKVFTGHNDSVRGLLRIKFFSDGNDRIFSSGSADENIFIWNLKTGNIIDKLQGHKDGILCLKQIPNKEKLTILSGSGGYNEEPLKIWK